MRLDYLTRRFSGAAQMRLGEGQRRLAASAAKLDALSPLKVLSRGYAIAYKGEAAVTSVKEIAAGDRLRLQLCDGECRCTAD